MIVDINLGSRSYRVVVASGELQSVGQRLRDLRLGARAALVSDAAVMRLYGKTVVASLETSGFSVTTIEVPEGEAAKTLAVAQRCWDRLLTAGLDRTSTVLALGGGAVGDVAGFAAATYMRGMPLVQVPTTLLAQVDAAIGGKVAVNHPKAKNLIGAFHQPRLVLIDPATLGSLPEREYRSGLAEVVKTGAALNADLFAQLERSIDALGRRAGGLLTDVITTCGREKAAIVEQDEREESGTRMVLNYGHTVGHALETLGGYQTWLHGEAVAIGLAAAARLGERLGLSDAGTRDRQITLLEALGLPVRFSGPSPSEVHEVLRRDKKARDGQVPFVLLKRLGHAEVCFDVPPETLRAVLEEIHG